MVEESSLQQIEKTHPDGVTSAEILLFLSERGLTVSEATLRKYVQLGLLPRSVRVGQKGKHRGSRGVYPIRVVRQIVLVKEMLAADYTIEQIQKEFLLLRGDIDQLEETLAELFGNISKAVEARATDSGRRSRVGMREVSAAKTAGRDLLGRLRRLESRLSRRETAMGNESVDEEQPETNEEYESVRAAG